MNAARDRKYWWLFGPVRAFYKGRGLSGAQIEERRHAIHRKVLGYDKSHTDLTKDEFDALKGAFHAVWDGGNFDAQLYYVEEAEAAPAALIEQCMDQVRAMVALGDERLADDAARAGYVASTARRVVKKELDKCSTAELGKVRGCLARRVVVMRRRRPDLAAKLDEQSPF